MIIFNKYNGKKYLISGTNAYKMDTSGVYELVWNNWVLAKEV